MKILKCIFTKNDCYKAGKRIKPSGIVVHSTGANNPALKRYVQPDDGILGVNKNHNDWNRPGVKKCVNAFIGKDKNGIVRVYQTLPWTMRPWGCGSGKKGSYNNTHIQFEICEDNLKDQKYFNEVFDAAAELCSYLCKEYGIKVSDVVSHYEAYKKGYASGHSDCDNWLKKFGANMDWFRSLVSAKIGAVSAPANKTTEPKNETAYTVKITATALNVRAGESTKYKVVATVKKGQTYTIVDEKDGWGKLKSGTGWICLKYTERV